MEKIVLTGAGGRLGSYLREPLTQLATTLLSTDKVDNIGNLYAGEQYTRADLSQLDQVEKLMPGADMVVHFGAIADEAPFDDILQSNIIGAYTVWEAARRQQVRRVVYASSIHAVGMHPLSDMIGIDATHRPDTYYGLAKCFAEDLARLYWDKHHLEAVCLRIASCANVSNARALSTWLSYDDLIQLVTKAITARITNFSIIYGVSNNSRIPFDNSKAAHLGYRPQDNAEQFAPQILRDAPPPDVHDLAQVCIGGPFATVKLGNSGVAALNITDEKKTN